MSTTEDEFEAAEEAAFREFALRKYREIGDGRVTDEFVSALRGYLDKRGEALRVEAGSYETSVLDRYSYFYGSVTEDPSHVVAIFKFSHITRRHAWTPDGWAMMRTTRLVLIDTVEDTEFWQVTEEEFESIFATHPGWSDAK